MRRRRILSLLAAVTAFAMMATACQTSESDDTEDVLKVGYVLPETGDLSFLGAPMVRGIEMAIDEIDEAGGPLGLEIQLFRGDETDNEAAASEAAGRVLSEGVAAIIGAASSPKTMAIIDQVTGAEVVECSPSNTGPDLTDYEDGGYYFRTAPSDALQGPILADVIIEDGRTKVALLARADIYGRGLADATAAALEAADATVVMNESYDPDSTTFDAEATAAADSGADAVVIISYDEGQRIIPALFEAGFTAGQLYGADGIKTEKLNELVDPGNPNVVDGFKGTAPQASVVEGFIDRLKEFDPELEETIYAPQSYDCMMLIALAAHAADSVDPTVFVGEIVGLTRGDNECTGFEECSNLLDEDQTISYQFASGTKRFTDAGEPADGTYEVWEWKDGALTTIDQRAV